MWWKGLMSFSAAISLENPPSCALHGYFPLTHNEENRALRIKRYLAIYLEPVSLLSPQPGELFL